MGVVAAQPLPQRSEARAQRSGLRAAITTLGAVAERPLVDRVAWDVDVDAALDELRAALARHVAFTQGPDGLFAEMREQAPRLLHRVERLEADHAELGAQVDRCQADLAVLNDESAARSVDSLVDSFERHQHRGVELVYDAYNVDISSGD
jgi:hypothetical protein